MRAPAPPRREGVVRSVVWLASGNVAVKPLWFLFITAGCMRGLGVVGYGEFTAALAFGGLFVAVSELGTSEYLTRETARCPEATEALFANLLTGRAALLAVVVGLVAAVGHGLGLGYLGAAVAAGAYAGATRLTELCRALYRSFAVLRFEAGSMVVERVLVITGGAAALAIVETPAGVLWGMAVGASLSLIANVGWVHQRLSRLRWSAIRGSTIQSAYEVALPIGLFGLFTLLYHGAGPVLIEWSLGQAEAGRFGAAWRVIEMLMLLPSTVIAVLLPRLAKAYQDRDRDRYVRLFGLSAVGLGAATSALAVSVGVAAPVIIRLLGGGEFAGTAHLLRLIVAAYPFMSLTMLLSLSLIAVDAQRVVAVGLGVVAILYTVTLALIVDERGAEAAAVGLIVGYALLTVSGFVALYFLGPKAAPPPLSTPSLRSAA